MEWRPIFAEDTVGPGGWVAVAIAVISSGSTVVLGILAARHKNRQEREATAISQWREYADRLEDRHARQDEQIARLTEDVARSRVAELACREEVAELRAALTVLYEDHRHVHAEATRLGAKLRPLPPMPDPRPHRASVVETSFVLKNRQHQAGLIQQENEDVQSTGRPPAPRP